jgi:hypothetical protein
MAIYISLPTLNEVVRFVADDPACGESVKSMASGNLNYYFPGTHGFAVAPEHRGFADAIILRIHRRFPGNKSFIGHTVDEASKIKSDPLTGSLDQLQTALEISKTECGRCWALMVHGPYFQVLSVLSKFTCTRTSCSLGTTKPAATQLIPCAP